MHISKYSYLVTVLNMPISWESYNKLSPKEIDLFIKQQESIKDIKNKIIKDMQNNGR